VSLALGCSAASREPTGLGGGAGGGGAGGGGSSGGGGTDAALVGSWRNVTLFQTSGDFQTVTTTWTFAADGDCSRTVSTLSALEGIPLTETRACRFSLGNFQLLIIFEGATAAVPLDFRFAGVSATRLILAGLEFQKISA
jgi:hypothetical protein